jgi:GAF domain-containing protein
VNTDSVEDFLHEMAVLAGRALGSDLCCAMAMGPGPRPATLACSDPLAGRVDAVQYELEAGPGLQAVRDGRPVRIEDTAEKIHWPEFERRAAAQGIRSCLALPLRARGQLIGALNLYARDAGAFGAAEAQRGQDFAEHAAGALSLATRLASRAALIEQLRSALASRTVIDQALGIIMAREECGPARAFAILRAASQQRNVKLRDIAGAIVTSVAGEPPQQPFVFEDD